MAIIKKILTLSLSVTILAGCGLSYKKSLKEKLPSDIDLTNTIIFEADTNSNKLCDPQIFAVKVDSPRILYQLTNTRYPLSDPVWLPDGSGIMFLSIRFDTYKDNYIGWADDPEIYIIDTIGTWRIIKCWNNLSKQEREKYDYMLNGYIRNKPILASDKVLYNVMGNCLIIQDTVTSEVSFRYIDRNSLGLSEFGEFALSPDGKKLAFVSQTKTEYKALGKVPSPSCYAGIEEISIMNIEGTDYKRLTLNKVPDGYPCWSKDGKSIYFDRDPNWKLEDEGNFHRDIFIMNQDGTNQRNLTDSPTTDDYRPECSPDGKYIAYVSSREEEYTEIWIINTDGSNRHRILKLRSFGIGSLSWFPK